MRWLLLSLLAWLMLGIGPSQAHEFRPAVLSMRQTDAGTFRWRWQPAFDARRKPLADVQPEFPEHCTAEGEFLDCHDQGLGEITISGLDRHPVDVVVRVRWADDRRRTEVLHGERNRVEFAKAPEDQSVMALLSTYLALGVEHILIGIDHVLFVLGLLMLVGVRKRLLWAVTGFTLAHSLTLAASTLGWAALPQGPVEACIALSIVLLATELVHQRPTLTRARPGLVAFAFGLLHGFGFAGALQEIGVPADRAWTALLGFNLGVELGQLGIIAVAGVLGLLARRLPHPERWRLVAAYAGGTVAAAWTIERIIALVG